MENQSYTRGSDEDLNQVIMDLVTGLRVVAQKVKSGADSSELGDELENLARTICNHWPDCFTRDRE